MKKILVAILILMTLLAATTALAEGVTVLSAPNAVKEEEVSLDDMKLGTAVTVDGYAVITPIKCEWMERMSYGRDTWDVWYYQSGTEADYLVLEVQILNTQYEAVSFLDTCEVKAEFGEGYVFGGWRKQYWNSQSEYVHHEEKNEFSIDPLYVGRYAFIVTLPNFCKESKEPLSITVKLTEDVEFTYHVRK